MRVIIQLIASNIIIRFLVNFFIYIKKIIDRIWSNLKFKALVKNSGNSICHYSTEIKHGKNIKIGNNTRIGPNCTISGKGGLTIGDNVVISKNVTLETAGLIIKAGPPYNKHFGKKIIIEDGVWIGTNTTILGGVKIKKNSIIGAGSLIVNDIEPNSIVVANAAKFLRINN